VGKNLKRLVYRLACWLEMRALDIQDWAIETPTYDLNDVVVGGINRDPSPFWKNNALLNHLQDRASANG
jgi:hypothetical protein